MSYEEFKEEVMARLKDYYGNDAEITTSAVLKNNDVRMTGINIAIGDKQKVVPVIYLEPYYQRFIDDVQTVDEIVEEITELRKGAGNPGFNMDEIEKLTSWDNVKDKIYPILLSTKGNAELLKKYISKEFLDLSIVYVIRLTSDGPDTGSVKITHELMENYGISEDALYAQAMSNMDREGYSIQDIVSVLRSMNENLMGWDAEEGSADMNGHMFVLSNSRKTYGAAGILINRLLRSMGRDLFILPSSVHETIIVPVEEGMNEDDLDQMIREVNGSQLDPQDILSDHAYFFDYKEDRLKLRAAA